jgi:hypothetical protein
VAASESFNGAVSGASSGRGEDGGQGRAARARTREQVMNSPAGSRRNAWSWPPRARLSAAAETLVGGRLPDEEVVANLESEIRKVYEVGGRRFRVALLPVRIPASREAGCGSNRNCGGFRRKCERS